MKRFWKDVTPEEKSALPGLDYVDNLSDWIAILPLGATEQHGEHLPLDTDTLIAEGIVNRLSEQLDTNEKVTFLPVEEIGYSPEHLDYPGSISLDYATAIEKWISIGQELNQYGIRKLILLNAHGGNSPLMTIVATELRVRSSMLAVATSWTRFGTPKGLIDENEQAIGIHGGDIETSVMLALHPDKIDLEKLENFPSYQSDLENNCRYLRAYGKHAFGWKMQDLNQKGVVGNTLEASITKGERLIDHAVQGLMTLIDEVRDFDLARLDHADQLKMDLK